jgi:two-component system phosphate regulon sensor histidine kinase PhoR
LGSELQQTVNRIQKRISHLEEEREKISAIVQNLLEGVVAFDAQGHVLFGNSSACRILGLDEQRLQGQSVWEVIRNKELAELVERCRALALHERQRVEVAIHTPSRMIVEVYGLPFPLANQKNGSVIVLHDVTQLRRLEQVRAEFIDNVSHELRTPLAAIIGYLETLIDEPSLETPNNRKFVHVAHQHAERLNRLVDDLRSLSEIESGKVVLRWETVRLRDVVEEVTEMLQSQGQKKRLQFLNEIDGMDCVWADRDRVVQILVNLVDNAIKYSLEGGSISFLIQRLETSIVLQVKDTGQGIPSNDLSRITERFYRVDRARSREEGGTGLGLSIVKHLVQLLGGQLRIHSELGKGTSIELDLPIPSQKNLPLNFN